jgi:hypothetical protein
MARAALIPRAAVAALIIGCLASAGCGQVSAKQARIEASSVSSTASEGATIASEYGRGRLGATFARVQLQKLASDAGAPASALGTGPAVPGVGQLAATTQSLALDSQRILNQLAARGEHDAARRAATIRLAGIAEQAGDLADQAEAIELAGERD